VDFAVEDAAGLEADLTYRCAEPEIDVALLTGGADRPYAFGLATALISRGVRLDLVAGDELDGPEFHGTPSVRFLNLRGDQRSDVDLATKISRVLVYYGRLIRYALSARPRVFHILWNNKFEVFDRTLLMLYYRLLRKRVTLTVHNVNAGIRDLTDTSLNRFTLRIQYRLADHIFVHTERMKAELVHDFGVREALVSVIPFGINNAVPHTNMTSEEARQRLGVAIGEKTLLFFGTIAPYKGLEYLVDAFHRVATRGNYRLIIAGRPRAGSEAYWSAVQQAINRHGHADRIIQKIEFVPDEETELYFKAADAVILPYTEIFQSGVLFLGYSFGLPVIAADVGSMADDIIEGKTGFVFAKQDAADLARVLESYFASDLYKCLPRRRKEIRDYANERHSWEKVSQMTRNVYQDLLENRS
jgi:glycosyltransferase involved in cell wall biosynthesis